MTTKNHSTGNIISITRRAQNTSQERDDSCSPSTKRYAFGDEVSPGSPAPKETAVPRSSGHQAWALREPTCSNPAGTTPRHLEGFSLSLAVPQGRGQKPRQTPQAKANAHGRWDDTRGWEYWSGGFSPSAGQVPWKARPQPKAGVRFPGFEDIVLPSSASAMPAGRPPTPVINVEEHRDAALVSEVQAALNGARKAEQRVAKLRAQSAMTKWQHFEAQMKAAFQKESERFVALKDRLSREIAEAEHAQQTARQLVRQTIAQEPAPMAVENTTTDQIFDGWLKENDSHLSAVLQRCARTPKRMRPGVPLSPTFHGKTQAHYAVSQVTRTFPRLDAWDVELHRTRPLCRHLRLGLFLDKESACRPRWQPCLEMLESVRRAGSCPSRDLGLATS